VAKHGQSVYTYRRYAKAHVQNPDAIRWKLKAMKEKDESRKKSKF
jgi:hypothetical protein